MEITSITVTKSAVHKTDDTIFNIDYSDTDGRLSRVQIDILRPPHGSETETYMGTVHFDGQSVSCSLRWDVGTALLFETAVGFIDEIISTAGIAPTQTTMEKNKPG